MRSDEELPGRGCVFAILFSCAIWGLITSAALLVVRAVGI
jgi:hypothetical protein